MIFKKESGLKMKIRKRIKLTYEQKEILFSVFEIKYDGDYSYKSIFEFLKILKFNDAFVKSLDLILLKLENGLLLKNAIEVEWKKFFDKNDFYLVLALIEEAENGNEKAIQELKKYYNLKTFKFFQKEWVER